MIDPRAAARELLRRAAAKRNYVDHEPHPKQRAFLALECREALFGGAAGGGKSDALLMSAAKYIHVPGYAALLMRRTYPDLTKPGALMDRAKSWWLPHKIAWSDKDKRFTFPSGATITFGYMDSENDKYNYQGAEIQFLGVDELTQWPQSRYTYLLSRLRRLQGSEVPIRARATANPGGIGHDWVKRRFVDSTDPGKVFVPSRLVDNPSLDRAEYESTLAELDPVTRRQLLDGVWVRDGSGLVYAQWDAERNMGRPESWPAKFEHVLLGLDFGIVDQNGVTILGWNDGDPCIYILASYRLAALVTEMASHVADLEARYKFECIVGDVGGMGKAFAEEMRRRWALPVEPADKQNKLGYISLFNGALADGRIKVHPTDGADLVHEWEELPWDEGRTKEMGGFANHAADSCLYAWRRSNSYHERPIEAAKDPKTAWERHWDALHAAPDDPLERAAIERIGEEQHDPRSWWEREQ